LGEFEKIADIYRLARQIPSSRAVRLGIGDDCCLLTVPEGEELALSTDTVVEEIHFRLSYFDHYQVGAKAMLAALSDLAAMAASPVGALATVSIKEEKNIDELARGLIDAGAKYGCPLIGGDLTSSTGPLVVTVTVAGLVKSGSAVLRSTARPGDRIWVTGAPGDAAAVLACLEEEMKSEKRGLTLPDESLKKKFYEPVPRLAEARALIVSGPPTAMIDISDGLAADLGHILESSGAGARLFAESFPLSSFSSQVAIALGFRAEHFFLHGGEDYELLFTVPPGVIEKEVSRLEKETSTTFTLIGEINEDSGKITIMRPDGSIEPITGSGFDHFTH
jgi:thiamine-monophosphate kinase